ncbi:MAG TPA: ABC transporter permease [Acidimicrobiia bacterium]|mgnify:FL=1|nr:ABC transporter permease [Acidimicrobiia bacterium]
MTQEEQLTTADDVDIAGRGPRPRGPLLERIAPSHIDWRSIVLVPLLAVFTALVIGALIIVFTEGPDDVLPAYLALFRGAFVGINAISETLTAAAPLIIAGLSVALGFRAGLFNIGVEGQMTIGGMTAVLVGFMLTGLPLVVHLPLAILAGFIGGAIWGGIPGWLRAQTGAHEVITTIMLNFIAYRLVDYLLKQPAIIREGRFDPISRDALPSARLPQLLDWINPSLRLHGGFILALLLAWGIWWLLFRSTVGFEFRAVGSNPNAAAYAGMSVTLTTVLVMAIAGGLGGLAGANQTLGVLYSVSPGFTAGIGFDAIALALLGRSHPGGVVLAGLLFGALRAGGQVMQVRSGVGIDLIVVVQALIIVFIAAPALVRAIYRVRAGEGTGQLTRGWSA